jgi:hypothetical protein
MLNGPACHRQKFFGAPRSTNDKMKPAIRYRSWQSSDRVKCLRRVKTGKAQNEQLFSASHPDCRHSRAVAALPSRANRVITLCSKSAPISATALPTQAFADYPAHLALP